jgi:hypothetical protein
MAVNAALNAHDGDAPGAGHGPSESVRNRDVEAVHESLRRIRSSATIERWADPSGRIPLQLTRWNQMYPGIHRSHLRMNSRPRIGLPSDLSGSLKHLDDAQLQRLHEAVALEVSRRNQTPVRNEPATTASSRGHNDSASRIDELPAGKANLIRASFKAGVKPAVIARTFGISQSLVSRVLGRTGKSQR